MLVVPLIMAMLLPQVTPIDVSQGSSRSFAFDWTGTHADGTPGSEVAHVELHYAPVPPRAPVGTGDGHTTVKLPFVATVGENTIAMRDALEGVVAGVYDLSVRLLDPAGTPSGYSELLAVRVRVVPPQTPTGLRVVGN